MGADGSDDFHVASDSDFQVPAVKFSRGVTGWVQPFCRTLNSPTHFLQCGCFQKIGIPQNGCFIMENPIKMDDMYVKNYGAPFRMRVTIATATTRMRPGLGIWNGWGGGTVDGHQKPAYVTSWELVVYPTIYHGFWYIPGGCLGFLNHQHYRTWRNRRWWWWWCQNQRFFSSPKNVGYVFHIWRTFLRNYGLGEMHIIQGHLNWSMMLGIL